MSKDEAYSRGIMPASEVLKNNKENLRVGLMSEQDDIPLYDHKLSHGREKLKYKRCGRRRSQEYLSHWPISNYAQGEK